MKSKTSPLFMLMFSYAVYSFAVCLPDNKMGLNDWLMVISLNAVVNIVLILLSTANKNLSGWAQNIILVYFIFLFSKQIYKMWSYLKLYHGRQNGDSIVYVTILLILIFVVYPDLNTSRFSLPLFCFTVGIFVVILLFLAGKASRYNIYMHTSAYTQNSIFSVTMFDYIIPLLFINNQKYKISKINMIKYVFIVNIVLILAIIFIFSCFRGEYMYSISPLQIGFQVLSSDYVRNFDGVFTFLLIFAYFASVTVIYEAIKETNHKYKYVFLLLIPIFFMLVSSLSPFGFLSVDLLILLVIITGRCKNETY